MHRTRNAAYGQPYRGFESLPLRSEHSALAYANLCKPSVIPRHKRTSRYLATVQACACLCCGPWLRRRKFRGFWRKHEGSKEQHGTDGIGGGAGRVRQGRGARAGQTSRRTRPLHGRSATPPRSLGPAGIRSPARNGGSASARSRTSRSSAPASCMQRTAAWSPRGSIRANAVASSKPLPRSKPPRS
jgi:hypothetical protein